MNRGRKDYIYCHTVKRKSRQYINELLTIRWCMLDFLDIIILCSRIAVFQSRKCFILFWLKKFFRNQLIIGNNLAIFGHVAIKNAPFKEVNNCNVYLRLINIQSNKFVPSNVNSNLAWRTHDFILPYILMVESTNGL